jgi:putative ABC transport system permease protein
LALAFLAGCAAGAATGFLHVKLHITDLLSGILVMTALWSVNLVILGGRAVLPFYNKPTVFNTGIATLLSSARFAGLYKRRVLILVAVIAIVVKVLLDLYYQTKSGLMLRAAGDNAQFVSAQGVDPGRIKALGLMLGNGLAALSGSVLAQQAESANIQSGTGMVVMGLASVIIGTNLLGGVRWIKATTAVLFGTILYKAALVAAMQLGLPTNYLKLLMSALFVAALMAGKTLEGRRQHADTRKA